VHERVDKYQKVAPPKSSAGYRTVPIGPQLAHDLYEHRVKNEGTIDDLVFPGKDGSYLRHDVEMKSWFEPLRKKITAPKLRWHDLRHYAISCWIEAGLNPKVVQTRAGHSSIQITYDRYGHLLDKQQGGEEMAGIESKIYKSEQSK
jgi:integrase